VQKEKPLVFDGRKRILGDSGGDGEIGRTHD